MRYLCCRYLEQLLNECLKAVPYLSFPRLHSLADTPVCLRPENKICNTVTPPQKTAFKKKTKSVGKKGEARGKGVAKGTAGEAILRIQAVLAALVKQHCRMPSEERMAQVLLSVWNKAREWGNLQMQLILVSD